MVFDYSALRGRIREKFQTEQNFCKAFGVAQSTLTQKLNNTYAFNAREIVKACDLLEIPLENVHRYFFTLKIQITEVEQRG